jgi:hypothetical protein
MTSAANPNHEIHILSSYLAYGTQGKHWHPGPFYPGHR